MRLLWMLSKSSVSFSHCGAQNSAQDSGWGSPSPEQSGAVPSLAWCPQDTLGSPAARALLTHTHLSRSPRSLPTADSPAHTHSQERPVLGAESFTLVKLRTVGDCPAPWFTEVPLGASLPSGECPEPVFEAPGVSLAADPRDLLKFVFPPGLAGRAGPWFGDPGVGWAPCEQITRSEGKGRLRWLTRTPGVQKDRSAQTTAHACACPVPGAVPTRVRVLGGIPAVFYASLCRQRLTVSRHGSLRGRSVLQVGITSCFSSRKSFWDSMAKILRCVYLAVKVICVSVGN